MGRGVRSLESELRSVELGMYSVKRGACTVE